MKLASVTPVTVPTEKKAERADTNLEDAVIKILEKHQVGNLQFIMQSLNDLKASNPGDALFLKSKG